MNKFVVTYSTGEYSGGRDHTEPILYDGTTDELKD